LAEPPSTTTTTTTMMMMMKKKKKSKLPDVNDTSMMPTWFGTPA
jgi:hypothetical protein